MAEKKDTTKKSTTRSSTTRTSSRSTKNAVQAEKDKYRREATAVFQIFFALFLLIGLVLPLFGADENILGTITNFTNDILLGVLGHAGVFVPFALIYLGIVNAFGAVGARTFAKKFAMVMITVNTALFLQIFAEPLVEPSMADYYSLHVDSLSGGVVGGYILELIEPLLGVWAVALLAIAIYIVSLIPLFNITIEKVFRKVFPDKETRAKRDAAVQAAREKARKDYEKRQKEETAKIAERAAQREEKLIKSEMARMKRTKNIDIDIDDNSSAEDIAKEIEDSLEKTRQEEIAKKEEKARLEQEEKERLEKENKPKFELPKVPIFHFNSAKKVPENTESIEIIADETNAAVSPTLAQTTNEVITTADIDPMDAPPTPAQVAYNSNELAKVLEEAEPIKITKEELAHEILQVDMAASDDISIYKFPPTSLLNLDPNNTTAAADEEIAHNSLKIISTLKSFGVEATLLNVAQGPTVTRYELAPAAGVKISKITNLSDDIALSLAASGVRIEAPIPGKAAIGIEVPNKNTAMVYLRSMLESEEFRKAQSPLTFALGKDIGGTCIVGDIAKMPHVLIAGATGAGKSVCINSLIISLLYKSSPSDVRLIMVDPKVVELGSYNGIPHLLIPVVTDPKKAAGALSWAVGEMMKRYKMFAEKGVKDITGYNLLAPGDEEVTALPRIVIIIDELADLMMVAPGEVEDSIMRLAQMARAAGMHLVIATQRPTVNVITGTIKANVPSRIAFAVSSQIDSRTILDSGGAEKLVGKGDMLYSPIGSAKPVRLQGCFVTDKEVEAIVSLIKSNGEAVEYDDAVMEQIEKESEKNTKGAPTDGGGFDEDDDMLSPAIDFVIETGNASTSMLQRKLKLGYARAARLMDVMEERGIVGPPDGSKPRQVLLTRSDWQEMKLRQNEL